MAGTVTATVVQGVAQVSIDNPGKFNAMSRAMWRKLKSVFTDIQDHAEVRCVVVRGRGGHFCAGGDITEYPDFRFDSAQLRDFHDNDVWGGLAAILGCDVPVLACIEGNCMGAGVEIASCCDMRIASECARFGAPIARLGFPMAPREAALVVRVMGELTAREMLLAAVILDAPEMRLRGCLNQVTTAAGLEAAVAARVECISGLAPKATRLNKQVFRALALVDIESLAPDLIVNAYQYANSDEHREGIAAFLEKRPPRFG
jgi:enoyl-CoA hydratase/carnithine racemase